MVRQEEEEAKQGAEEEEAAGTGEDLCHPSGYNKETARAVSLNMSVWWGEGVSGKKNV